MRTYKVVEIGPSGFFKTLKPSDLQDALNREAADGWIYQREIAGSPQIFGSADVLLLIFYRDV